MYRRVKATIEKYGMLEGGERVMVCVSGGPDSVFLLHALNHIKKDFGLRLVVANLDHGVRGAASKKDSDFVKEISSAMGLKCIHGRLKSSKRAAINRKLSREENLREARYGFFEKAAKESKADVLATGHTLDDNAETVIMRIVRGASLSGLAGIPPARPFGSFKIIRPLIETEKKDIINFLNKQKIDYRIDHTNLEEAFLRNRVRKKLIPFLAEYNPRIKFALVNMAESLREDLEFMKGQRALLKSGVVKGAKPVLSVNLKDIVIQPKALQREILKDALEDCGANIKKLNFRHWKEMHNFLKFKRNNQSMDLPGDIRITRTHQKLIFKPRNLKSP